MSSITSPVLFGNNAKESPSSLEKSIDFSLPHPAWLKEAEKVQWLLKDLMLINGCAVKTCLAFTKIDTHVQLYDLKSLSFFSKRIDRAVANIVSEKSKILFKQFSIKLDKETELPFYIEETLRALRELSLFIDGYTDEKICECLGMTTTFSSASFEQGLDTLKGQLSFSLKKLADTLPPLKEAIKNYNRLYPSECIQQIDLIFDLEPSELKLLFLDLLKMDASIGKSIETEWKSIKGKLKETQVLLLLERFGKVQAQKAIKELEDLAKSLTHREKNSNAFFEHVKKTASERKESFEIKHLFSKTPMITTCVLSNDLNPALSALKPITPKKFSRFKNLQFLMEALQPPPPKNPPMPNPTPKIPSPPSPPSSPAEEEEEILPLPPIASTEGKKLAPTPPVKKVIVTLQSVKKVPPPPLLVPPRATYVPKRAPMEKQEVPFHAPKQTVSEEPFVLPNLHDEVIFLRLDKLAQEMSSFVL